VLKDISEDNIIDIDNTQKPTINEPVIETVIEPVIEPVIEQDIDQVDESNVHQDISQDPMVQFGTLFPTKAQPGDLYLRTDHSPSKLFRFNGKRWVEVSKNENDLYTHDDRYIKYLIGEIDAGRYDANDLTDSERNHIKEYLARNEQI
jgi:hypothetical protein